MKVFRIEENDANGRLDKFLKKIFPNATRGLIYKLNRKEKIKVKSSSFDGKYKKMDNEYKLAIGDEVKIFISDLDYDLLSKKDKKENNVYLDKNNFKKDIIYEDGDLLIINKNAGVNVHPGDYKTKELSLIQMVHDYLGDKYNSLTFRPSLIHRIDKDTSGLVMVAKKKDILQLLSRDFKNHNKINKLYYAIVIGKLSSLEGTIDKKLERIKNAYNENKVKVSKLGQNAITHYKVLSEKVLNTKEGSIYLSELEINIETGRMHQIRVHLSSIGAPILGDKIYGNKKLNSFFANNYGFKRQALHSKEISFYHYGQGEQKKLVAKLKDDLVNLLKQIN